MTRETFPELDGPALLPWDDLTPKTERTLGLEEDGSVISSFSTSS